MRDSSRTLSRVRLAVVLAVVAVGVPTALAHTEAEVFCDGLVATIVGGGGADVLPGTSGDDVIHGLQGNDTITGGGGTDVICVGEGNDHTGADRITKVFGGPGDDLIVGSTEPDRLHGGPGDDTIKDDVPGNQFSDSIYGGPGDDTITSFALSGSAVRPGSGRDNVTFKGSARLWFDDAPGRVVVDVAAGTVTGDGPDTVDFGPGTAVVFGSPFDDVLRGSGAKDLLIGLDGDDRGPGSWRRRQPHRKRRTGSPGRRPRRRFSVWRRGRRSARRPRRPRRVGG